jgi:hypothetical protein
MVLSLMFCLRVRMVWPRPKVDVGGGQIFEALVVAPQVVVIDELGQARFELTGK